MRCSDITGGLKFSDAKNKLLILDCCSAGTGAKGIRGSVANLTEVVHDSESFMIFAASEALEPTREHERWSGSFLSHLLVDALGKHRRLTLSELNEMARAKAKQHQGDHPDERLSMPFMFGIESGRFSLTYNERSAIAVRFDDQLNHNLAEVITQVRKSKLAPHALRYVTQWQIEWPAAYDRRFEELAKFKAAGAFPTRYEVDPEPLAKMVDELSKRRIAIEEFIARALRECLSRIVEGNTESDDWRLMLDIALRSAVFLLGRTLYAIRFDAEGAEPWLEPFLHTEIEWGSDIILGLAPVWTSLQADEPVLFWTTRTTGNPRAAGCVCTCPSMRDARSRKEQFSARLDLNCSGRTSKILMGWSATVGRSSGRVMSKTSASGTRASWISSISDLPTRTVTGCAKSSGRSWTISPEGFRRHGNDIQTDARSSGR